MNWIREKKALFVGCAKDCAGALPGVLYNIQQMSGLFGESAFVFLENDSRDTTKHELSLWCADRPNAHLQSENGLVANHPIRTIRLARLRNRYVSLIQPEFRHYDFLFVVDCDDVNAGKIDLEAAREAITFLQTNSSCAGVFANSRDTYYDMWALRHPERCPGDVWEEACDYVFSHRVSDEAAFANTFSKRVFSLSAESTPLQVDSAFGGLGIYKISSVLNNQRTFVGHKRKVLPLPDGPMQVGWECCEHVAFNAGFRDLGQTLFILPYLVNYTVPPNNFHPSAWRTLVFPPHLAEPQI